MAVDAANNFGVPPSILTEYIQDESGFNPDAYNASSGAAGLGQILDSTAANPGYGITPVSNPYDPQQSTNFIAQYLSAAYAQLGSWTQAVSSLYNGIGGQAANPSLTTPNASALAAAQAADAGLAPPAATTGTAATQGSQATPNQSAASEVSGCTSWLTTPTACITATLEELGLVLLALVVIGGGLYLLKEKVTK
jgi:soluble lytic murein transglycosylase-like protein